MNEIYGGRLIAFIVAAFLLSLIAVPCIRRLAYQYNWFDKPDHRKIHKYPTPRLGGIGIFCSFVIISVIALFRNFGIHGDESGRIIIFLSGSLLIFLLGIFDDLRGMNAWRKFSVQIAAGLLACWAGFYITGLTLPFLGTIDIGLAGIPLTLLWIAGVTNAVNLIDGMNGLAGGVSAIAAFFVGLVAMQFGHQETTYLSLILMGSIIGFLPYNLRDGKIFMGDSGSLVIGYTLSVLSISAARDSQSGVSFLIPVVILGLPIMDTIMAMIRRGARGRGLFSADLGHIHHRLLARLLCPKKTVLTLYTVSIVLGLLALLISYEVRYLSNIIAAMMILVTVISISHYGNGEIKEVFRGSLNIGKRRKTPWYKNKIVYRISERISNAKDIEHIYRLLALAARELEVDMITLNVLCNIEDDRPGIIRFKWPLKGHTNTNGGPLWVTQYPLSLDRFFSGSLTYGKAEWKRRRRSEEDEIWVMELGKSVFDWLARAVKDKEIDLGDLDSDVVTRKTVTAYQ